MRTSPSFTAKHLALAVAIALSAVAAPSARAATYDNAEALRGVTSANGVFLVDLDDPAKLAKYLELIGSSHRSLAQQGIAPDFKVVVIGPTVKYLSGESPANATPAQRALLAQIAGAVQGLKAQQIRVEVCKIALDVFRVDPAHLVPGLTVVADGFVSLIGYQAQGYGLVPIY
ncbi:MAG TPA: DsrE family protein [Anaeromyxobacteraceae bacterium]|nr:DsrE family protein [Anaeromyxobacteraceae bacterium]